MTLQLACLQRIAWHNLDILRLNVICSSLLEINILEMLSVELELYLSSLAGGLINKVTIIYNAKCWKLKLAMVFWIMLKSMNQYRIASEEPLVISQMSNKTLSHPQLLPVK